MSVREGSSSKKGRELVYEQKSHTCDADEIYRYELFLLLTHRSVFSYSFPSSSPLFFPLSPSNIPCRLFFAEPVRLEPYQWYTIMAGINGPPSANGTGGVSHLVDDAEVRWEFMGTSHDTNGISSPPFLFKFENIIFCDHKSPLLHVSNTFRSSLPLLYL